MLNEKELERECCTLARESTFSLKKSPEWAFILTNDNDNELDFTISQRVAQRILFVDALKYCLGKSENCDCERV